MDLALQGDTCPTGVCCYLTCISLHLPILSIYCFILFFCCRRKFFLTIVNIDVKYCNLGALCRSPSQSQDDFENFSDNFE